MHEIQDRIIHKAMVDPLKMPLDTSLSQIMGNVMISLFCSFPISVAMRSSLLNYIILNFELREGPMYIKWRLGWLHFLSRDARRCNRRCLDSNTISKHSLHCVLGSVWNNSNSSTLPMSLIIFLDFSLNGL